MVPVILQIHHGVIMLINKGDTNNMKKYFIFIFASIIVFSCQKKSTTPPPIDFAAPLVGNYVGTYSYYYDSGTVRFDTSYPATAYITENNIDTVNILVPPLPVVSGVYAVYYLNDTVDPNFYIKNKTLHIAIQSSVGSPYIKAWGFEGTKE